MMRRYESTWLALALGLGSVAGVQAELTKICSQDYLIDFPDCSCDEPLPRALPFARFDYAGQPRLKNLQGIHLNLTIQGGDTLPGEFDFNRLTLGLDSVDTGLALNGFPGKGETTITFHWNANSSDWPSAQKLSQILADLNDDGLMQLDAAILDATPDDNFVNLYSSFLTGLCLEGEAVPEPAAVFAWTLVLSAAYYWRRRYSRFRTEPPR